MSSFRYIICKPCEPEAMELTPIERKDYFYIFNEVPWLKLLNEVNVAETKGDKIYFSPSLEIENIYNKHGVSISIVGDIDDYEFYIFYKRPEIKKYFFGLFQKLNEKYFTGRTNQTKHDALLAIKALLDNNLELLRTKWG
ncbi:hypothetical protein [Adhaeribacter pallidiroseus]|uniref:Uncharacterized protein n=1 Tax=Adhaeribacter pallidiroseus TaxID=2072847 RepID=A0A369QN66_9BACT|nr:hypothetical protein [Adhaeribacter pallidiroseus]RDC65810.1 hypothetical protein AHMF7616_04440 [Adhaeribacter pallidiroseus]